jgi:hypothetical protein
VWEPAITDMSGNALRSTGHGLHGRWQMHQDERCGLIQNSAEPWSRAEAAVALATGRGYGLGSRWPKYLCHQAGWLTAFLQRNKSLRMESWCRTQHWADEDSRAITRVAGAHGHTGVPLGWAVDPAMGRPCELGGSSGQVRLG